MRNWPSGGLATEVASLSQNRQSTLMHNVDGISAASRQRCLNVAFDNGAIKLLWWRELWTRHLSPIDDCERLGPVCSY